MLWFPAWIKNKHATINPNNTKDNRCFQYAIIAALHHQEIGKDSQRITKLKPHIKNYNWKDINFPTGPNDSAKFERINNNNALNILSASPTKKKINVTYNSDHNRKRENK